jgi:hypothetical protein
VSHFTYDVYTRPDEKGRQNFRLTWTDENGIYRTELGNDGNPVGYRRGQCFLANLQEHIDLLTAEGHTVAESRRDR